MRRETSSARGSGSAQQPSSRGAPGTNIGQSPESVDRTAQRHLYSGQVLAALTIGCIAVFIFLFVSAALSSANPENESSVLYNVLSTIGSLLLFALIIPVLIIDWRGAVTLNGVIKWRSMRVWLRIVAGFFALGLSPFLLVVYLSQAFQTYRYFKQQEPLKRRSKIAELEAQMGFMPHAEGTCRNCQKPLQIGAEYCAYCGVSVIEQPRICPNCATTTFPDAKWCPKCQHPLDTTSQINYGYC